LFLAFAIATCVKQWRWRVMVILFAFALVLLVGLTKIYLGANYLSDVMGAMAAGLAWLAFCLTAVETLRRYRHEDRRVLQS
ncbi:MAG TPA: phosphatase PAP2 family protein, partial [Candidatus Binatia bacterium]|nr:phosphatase PAP2 family protein [Candidatus Binatia bacterium]